MTHRNNVVPAKGLITEVEFLNAMVEGLARAQTKVGSQKALAFVMDLSPKQVGNIMAGGSTDPKRLWDAHAAIPDAHVMSEIADLYGMRVVPKDSICTSDAKLSQATCALLKKAIDAELDGVVDHRELLDMEHELLNLRSMIDSALGEIAVIRKPSAVAA